MELFERYQRTERALVLALMEMVINGVSTRKVKRITERLCGHAFSRSTVSELAAGLDAEVEAWNERPLSGTTYPFVWADAKGIKVRREGAVRATSILLITAVNANGRRSPSWRASSAGWRITRWRSWRPVSKTPSPCSTCRRSTAGGYGRRTRSSGSSKKDAATSG